MGPHVCKMVRMLKNAQLLFVYNNSLEVQLPTKIRHETLRQLLRVPF
jgi:hypothetical protein